MVLIFWAFAISISKNFTHGFTYNIKLQFIFILISFELENCDLYARSNLLTVILIEST